MSHTIIQKTAGIFNFAGGLLCGVDSVEKIDKDGVAVVGHQALAVEALQAEVGSIFRCGKRARYERLLFGSDLAGIGEGDIFTA